jgi:hypothetical protein
MTMSNADRLDARAVSDPASAGASKHVRVSRDVPPSVAEARKRLAAAAGRPQPWLTPAGLAALSDAPEVIGPATYQGVPNT